jgi:cyclopropane-fatty-acyl-phospholipid synthase
MTDLFSICLFSPFFQNSVLDIGFGWGGLSIHAAKKFGCKVVGITLSVEQKALAENRVKAQGLEELISFEVCDYRTFARRRENRLKFDRVLSCEMIEAGKFAKQKYNLLS